MSSTTSFRRKYGNKYISSTEDVPLSDTTYDQTCAKIKKDQDPGSTGSKVWDPGGSQILQLRLCRGIQGILDPTLQILREILWILDPALQILREILWILDPALQTLREILWILDPIFYFFFRGILSVFTDFITSITCFVLNSRDFGPVYILHGIQGILYFLILILCGIQRDLES